MKIYEYCGMTYWFEEGKQPAGAVEVKQAAKADKAAKPANKGRKVKK